MNQEHEYPPPLLTCPICGIENPRIGIHFNWWDEYGHLPKRCCKDCYRLHSDKLEKLGWELSGEDGD